MMKRFIDLCTLLYCSVKHQPSFIMEQVSVPSYVFEAPCTMSLSGATGCGKTTLLKRILSTPNMFSLSIDRVILCYGVWQTAYEDMHGVEFHKGLYLPNLNKKQHTVLIYDDLMAGIMKSTPILELVTKDSHHQNCSVILIIQNLYQKGDSGKGIMLNQHYQFLLHNARDLQQIRTLGRQLDMETLFIKAYKDCMLKPYSYLLLDVSPHRKCKERTLTTNIFPDEYTICFLDD